MTILVASSAFILALAVGFFLEKKFIPFLMRIKMGQTILEIGPRWHKSKEGTPTMGGIFFIAAITVSLLVFSLPAAIGSGNLTTLKVFGMMILFGTVGFLDDYVKFVKKRNKGLSAIAKLILQFVVAALFLWSMKDTLTTTLTLPFTDKTWDLGIFYWVFAILFIAFIVNAVNLTDGIDGLAASQSFVLFAFFAVLAFVSEKNADLYLYAAICGAMIGFLLYNYYPARVFMGDTGSLFLGGAAVGAAFAINNPLIVVVAGLYFVWEAVSVVLQVASFKLFHKRIFKMAPFHHHLEMCGWKEPKIVCVTAILTALTCVIAYLIF